MKISKRIEIVGIVFALVFFSAPKVVGEDAARPYEPQGPTETAALEGALHSRLAVYGWGIWPREEKFKGALLGKALPKGYVESVQEWLPRILKKEFLSENLDPNQWHGIRKLHDGFNFIVGRFRVDEKKPSIEFKANGLLLVITAVSEDFFPNGLAGLSNEQIIKAVTGFVNYPEDKVKGIRLERHFEQMGAADKKVLVCYGKLRDAEYDETKGPGPDGKNLPTWWNQMTFWMSKNKIFISTSMVDWKTYPASLEPYVFKF